MHLQQATEKFINIFNYLPMHMDMSAFDVSQCYKKAGGEMYVYLAIEGSYADVVSNQRYNFFSAAKSTIAAAAGISSLRIAKINVWQDLISSKLNFFFTILEPPSVEPQSPDEHTHPQVSCKDAFDKLQSKVRTICQYYTTF
jgi:hypothetical protein